MIRDPRGTLSVLAVEPSSAQLVLDQLTTLPTAALIAVMLVLLRRLLRGVRHGDPFTPTTVHRLRVLAGVMILGGLLAELIQFAAQSALVRTMAATPRVPGPSWFPALAAMPAAIESQGWWLLAGFGLLAVAEPRIPPFGRETSTHRLINHPHRGRLQLVLTGTRYPRGLASAPPAVLGPRNPRRTRTGTPAEQIMVKLLTPIIQRFEIRH